MAFGCFFRDAHDRLDSDCIPASDGRPEEAADLDPLDYRDGVALFSGNAALFREIVGHFCADVGRSLPVLWEALKSADYATLRRQSHRIRGGAANVRARPMARTAERLERASEAGQSEEATLALDELQREFLRLKQFLSLEDSPANEDPRTKQGVSQCES